MQISGRRQFGFSLVYQIILLTTLLGFTSLAVDWGRVQMIKTQLQRAADASARAAVSQLGNGISAAQNAAVTWGGYNLADGSSVVIDPNNDVEFGTWDSNAKTFTVLTGAARSGANAIRITARRAASRGTAPTLTFGSIIGSSTCDVNAQVIAANMSSPGPGIVGLSTCNLNQSWGGSIDSYNSSLGPYSGSNHGSLAAVASNSNITLSWFTSLSGSTYAGVGKSTSWWGIVSGSRSNVTAAMSYPAVNVGTYDNSGLAGPYWNGTDYSINSSVIVTVPAGTYYVRNFSLYSGCTLSSSGPVTFYVYGALDVNNSTINAYNRQPGNFRVNFVSGSTMVIENQANVEADLYGPAITFTIKDNNTNVYGRIVCNSLQQSGTSGISQDTYLTGTTWAGAGGTMSASGGANGGIATVK